MTTQTAQPGVELQTLSSATLVSTLAGNGYYTDTETADKIRMALTTQKGVCGARLVGPQGSGKTVLTRLIAKITNKKYFYLQATRGMTEAELFYGIMPDDTTKSGFSRFDGTILQAVRASLEGPIVLCLDEWDKTRPTSDGFLLDFLQEGRISHPAVKLQARLENLTVFICTNLDRELSEPLQRRLPVVDLGHPTIEVMHRILSQTVPDSLFIQQAVKIYAQTIEAGLAKPATAQELIQLLHALQQKTTPNVSDLDQMLDVFILKTESDRVRFRTWFKSNSAKTLQQMADEANKGKAPTDKYMGEEPGGVVFTPPVRQSNANDRLSEPLRPRQMRTWEYNRAEKTSAANAQAVITHPNIEVAMAQLPKFIRNPESWAIVDRTVATFEKFEGVDGIMRLTGLSVRENTMVTVALSIPHPIRGRTFTLAKIANAAEEISHYSRNEIHGYRAMDAIKHKVWFRATPGCLELIIETSQVKLELRPILDVFLTPKFMRWYLGEQVDDNPLFSAHSYGIGKPSFHGLFEIDTSKASVAITAEIKEKTRQWNFRIRQSMEYRETT